ncbi:hypothetical protein M8C21_005343 [Ambrosia artemisiifolia]|uniref:Uncharacterized protein n=1 Tax=Ambrosia artemisiifolia TaxID=4212 RepID=A0AAD5DEE0_AMBAR|nr:hypothetical protein M8C21_005343 [Ambrosia artemisiifolia]
MVYRHPILLNRGAESMASPSTNDSDGVPSPIHCQPAPSTENPSVTAMVVGLFKALFRNRLKYNLRFYLRNFLFGIGSTVIEVGQGGLSNHFCSEILGVVMPYGLIVDRRVVVDASCQRMRVIQAIKDIIDICELKEGG